ncbi:MAG: hypothetical protein KatS3mg115_2065 [Candidatus Poribacteria bacterium]|nr:MAG: hypothetical protein KatS3mg115_2065 [Candidatus Poribacteria bacterium]
MDRYVLPHVQRGEQVFFVVIDCLRYDQWLAIEPLLREFFEIRRELYYGILPSATAYARNALFSGLFPREIAERYPQYWTESSGTDQTTNRFEKQLMELKLQRTGLYLKPPPRYFKIFDKRGGEEYRRRLASFDRVRFGRAGGQLSGRADARAFRVGGSPADRPRREGVPIADDLLV